MAFFWDWRSCSRILSEERTAHNVTKRLGDKQKKFSSDFWKCWAEFVDEYNQVSVDYTLNQEQGFTIYTTFFAKMHEGFS